MTIGTLDNRALAQPVTSFTITVSRPLPVLRSNGGHGNKFAINRARQDAKSEAHYATLEALNGKPFVVPDGAVVLVQYTEILGPRAKKMDSDGLITGMKPYRDGIALALGIDDGRMEDTRRGTPQRGDASAVVCTCWWASEVGT